MVGVGGGIGGGSSDSTTEQFVQSLTKERQNGLAVELEEVADHHLQRLKRAANVGYWETSVAFAADSQGGAQLLAGAFAAELAKPNELGIPPRVTVCPLPERGLLPLTVGFRGSGWHVLLHHERGAGTDQRAALRDAPRVRGPPDAPTEPLRPRAVWRRRAE